MAGYEAGGAVVERTRLISRPTGRTPCHPPPTGCWRARPRSVCTLRAEQVDARARCTCAGRRAARGGRTRSRRWRGPLRGSRRLAASRAAADTLHGSGAFTDGSRADHRGGVSRRGQPRPSPVAAAGCGATGYFRADLGVGGAPVTLIASTESWETIATLTPRDRARRPSAERAAPARGHRASAARARALGAELGAGRRSVHRSRPSAAREDAARARARPATRRAR